MYFSPASTVRLIKGKLSGYEYQLDFPDIDTQSAFFGTNQSSGWTGANISNCTYIRANNVLQIPLDYDTVIKNGYNYIRFVNSYTMGTSNTNNTTYGTPPKYYYAFIRDIQYVSPKCTNIIMELDVWQTFQFDFKFNESLIEREHTNNDTYGLNLYPEGLETGEYISTYSERFLNYTGLMLMTVGGAYVKGTDGVFGWIDKPASVGESFASGLCCVYCCNLSEERHTEINNYLGLYRNSTDHPDVIKYMYLVPLSEELIAYNPEFRISNTPITETAITFARQTKFLNDGSAEQTDFTPNNNKTLTGEFVYCSISNNHGVTNKYFYEYSNGDNHRMEFALQGCFGVDGTIIIAPKDYKHANDEQPDFIKYDEAISSTPFVQQPYSNDYYMSYLAQTEGTRGATLQNAKNTAMLDFNKNLSQLLLTAGIAISTGGTSLLVGGGASAINSSMGMMQAVNNFENVQNTMAGALADAKHKPDTVTGGFSGGSTSAIFNKLGFTFERRCVSIEYAKKIDKYFDIYGYKTRRIGIPIYSNRPYIDGAINPSFSKRLYWNFIKTVNANLTGDIPKVYLDALIKMFNNGVTFWHKAEEFGSYAKAADNHP